MSTMVQVHPPVQEILDLLSGKWDGVLRKVNSVYMTCFSCSFS